MAQRPTLFQRPDRITEPLYVLTSVFNSPRFRTRWKLYQDFAMMVRDADAILYTVEVAFGDREFVIDEPEPPARLLQIRTRDELWLKENALNLLVAELVKHEPGADYLAFIDADLRFVRADWDDEIVQMLQHYAVLQPWTQALDLSSKYEVVGPAQRSLGWAVREGLPIRPSSYYYGGEPGAKFYHPGYAWAMRRATFRGLGGLLDVGILGSADNYMAQAMLGQVDVIIPKGVSPQYRAAILAWQERALAVVKGNVGCTDGLLLHHWHGAKSSRRYNQRNQILLDTQFNPDIDIKRDEHGLWQFAIDHRNDPRSRQIRDRVRAYFHSRREDDPSP